MNQIPDTELIKKSIDGDGQAFAALIKRVETRLLRLVRAEIADLTYAEDVLQEVLLDVWRGLKQLRDWERWEAWALQIARHRCYDFFGSAQRREEPMAHSDLEPIIDRQSGHSGIESELLDSVLNVLSEAPPDQAEAARLFYVEGLTIRQISVDLERPEGTIKRWLSNARSFVRSRLGLRKIRTERRKIMATEAFDIERNKREMLRTIVACREDRATSIHLKHFTGKTPPDELWTLTQLKNLSLRGGAIEYLPKEIGQLKELEKFDLLNTKLQRLPEEIVTLSRLRYLEVFESQVTELPEDFGRLGSLRVIILERSHLRELPDSFAKMNRLEIIEMNDNRLEKLPDDLSGLTNLRVLTLGNNRLSAVPQSIGELTAMEELYLGANQLTELPDEIGNLERLETFQITRNQVRALPSTIGGWKNLRHLAVESNQLTELPPEVGQMTELIELGVSNNQLRSLPKELADLPNLEVVRIHDNPLPERLIEAAKTGVDEFRQVLSEM